MHISILLLLLFHFCFTEPVNQRSSGFGSSPWFKNEFYSQKNKEIHSITTKLQNIYSSVIKPVEETYLYDKFYDSLLTDKDFDSKPTILLIGQYSVGKTSFIRYLLERDYQGMRIGPEPTTDKFISIMYGDKDRVIPGNAASISDALPFQNLQQFGTGFLKRFEVVEAPSPILKGINIIDTPGVLSGEKQRLNRSYDFAEVIHFLADRADLILLLFDAHKLDISDEMKTAIEALEGNDDKIRIVLNKADTVKEHQLMRMYVVDGCYGALMWSLGRVISNPEVTKVYISSFWDQPLQDNFFENVFKDDHNSLLADITRLPANNLLRKINDLIRRAKECKAHALLISYLRNNARGWNSMEKQLTLIQQMPEVFERVRDSNQLPKSDLPSLDRFTEVVSKMTFSQLPKQDNRKLEALDKVLTKDIPEIMAKLLEYQEKVMHGVEVDNENVLSIL